MANENQDLAVLGFKIKTTGADAAFKKILDSLGTVEKKFQETDTALEATVTKSMTELGRVVKGVNSAANALQRNKNIFDAFDSLSKFAEGAKNLKIDALAISEALRTLSNAGLASMARRLGGAFSTFERGTKVLEFEMKLANPDFLEKLQKDLLITIEPTTKAALSELKYSLDALAKGVIAKIIPSQDSLKELKQAVQDGIKPEIKFDENAKDIVANLYSAIRDGIKQQGPILVPLQFTFGKAKTDRPGTKLQDTEQQARDDVRKTLEEYAKDFGGMGGLNAVWDKAILGGPEAIEKIRRVLATRTGWLEKAVDESLDKAVLKPSKYGELVEQGLESIPVDVANTVDKLAGQLKALLKRHQEEFTFRPEIGTATQSEDDIKGVLADLASRVQKVSKKEFNSLPIPIGSVTLRPNNVLVSPVDAKTVFFATESIDADIKEAVLRPKTIKIDASAVDPKKVTLSPNSLDAAIKKVALVPANVKVDLSQYKGSQVPTNYNGTFSVQGKVAVTPTKITLDLPPGIKNQSILRITKPVIASADVLISPTSFAFKQGALNKIQASIGQTLDVKGYITGINQVQNAIQQLIPFATTLAAQLAAIHNNLSGGLAQLLTKKNVNAVNAMNNNVQTKQANQQKQQQALANINRMLKQPFSKTTIDNIRQTHEKAFDGLVQSLNKKGQVVHDVETGVISDIANATSATTANIANADAALQANTKILQQNAKTLRSNAAASRQVTMDTAKMAASVVGVNAPLRQMHLTIQDLEQVTLLNLEDPFKKMKAAIGDTGSRIADIGRMMGIYFSGRTIINFFREAAESANAFGMEIRRIQSLATDFDFSNLRNELMDIDARFGNVVHNANALYWAYSSGVRGSEKELANFVETMSKTATSIKADVMPTVDAATSIMNAWNLSASSAAEIGDLLFSIVKYGKSNAQQLTTSLGHVVAPAAALNIELNELGAAAATLTKTMKTNRAFTYLSNILGKMASPTKQVQEAAAELGIELSASAIKARGFANTLADIRKATGGDIAKIAKLFPDLRGQRAAITLLSTQYKDFEQQLENMRGKAGKMEEALSKIADTPESQLHALRNTISMISIGAGDAVNNVLTLGGALGPIIKAVNGLEHGGREILGHLVAAAGATAGIAISMKAIAAAQYASAKSAYDMAVAESETKRNALDVALSLERQAMEANKLAVADTNAQIAARLLNNEELKRLQTRKEILDTSIREGRNNVENAREALKMDDMITKRRYEDMATGIGQSTSRLAMLRGLKVNETTGQAAHDMERDLAILERLQMTITAESTKLDGQQTTFLTKAHKAIENYVLANKNLNTQLNTAITKTNVDNYKKYTELINTIVSKIKGTSVIAGEMNQILNGEEILKMAAKEFAVADLRKRMTEGTAFSHKVIVRLLDEEISKENHHLETLKAELNTQLQADKVNADRRAQVDAIAMSEATVAKLEQTRDVVIADIETRTKDLVQREQEYARILKENVNLTKSKLDADTRNVETLKKNLDANLRQAAVIGKDTLSAVRATSEAQLNYRSALIESRAVQADILRITDADGKLIVNSIDNQQKLLELQQKKVALLKMAVDERKRFIALGVRSGDIDARNMRIEELKANGASMSRIVKGIARDRGVVGEAVKQMSATVGQGIFGGMLGGRGAMGLSMLSSFVPGMGKWGMAASMLTGFNVFGRAASGMTRLTASSMNLLGVTEKLQKKGVMSLNKGIEDLTKSLMTSFAWTRKQAMANKALMGLTSGRAGSKAAMAGMAVQATWATAGIGVAIGAAIFASLYAYFKNNRSPFDGLAEEMFGVETQKQIGDMLEKRIEYVKQERESYDTMRRELQRMVQIQEEQKNILTGSVTAQKNLNALRNTLLKFDTVGKSISRRFVLGNQQDNLRALEEEYLQLTDAYTNASHDWTPEVRDKIKSRISELETLIPQQKAKIEKTTKELKDLFVNDMLAVGEYRAQSLRELMESDLESTFAPALDAHGKFELAEKTTSMALKQVASLLSDDQKNLIDLTGKTTDQIQDLILARLKTLSNAYMEAKIIYEDADKRLQDLAAKKDSPEYKKAEAEVEKLKTVMDDAFTQLENFQSKTRSTTQAYGQNLLKLADALVEETKESIRQNNLQAKVAGLRQNVDFSLRATSKNISDINDAIKELIDNYTARAGIFAGMGDKLREKIFKDKLKILSETRIDNQATRVGMLKSNMESIANFLESVSSETQNLEKSLFEWRLNNRAYANLRPALIRDRMKTLDSLLGGERGIYSLIDNAMGTANNRFVAGDFAGAAKALEEAQKYGAKARGIEEEKLDLIKKQADIEREINGSMYQLANTLRGQFAATTQQSVAADSVEALRLMSRQFGESIAPPVSTSYQEQERRYREQRMVQEREFATALSNAAVALQMRIGEEANNAKLNDGAAKTMEDAANKANTAVDNFAKTVNSSKTIVRVRRI